MSSSDPEEVDANIDLLIENDDLLAENARMLRVLAESALARLDSQQERLELAEERISQLTDFVKAAWAGAGPIVELFSEQHRTGQQ